MRSSSSHTHGSASQRPPLPGPAPDLHGAVPLALRGRAAQERGARPVARHRRGDAVQPVAPEGPRREGVEVQRVPHPVRLQPAGGGGRGKENISGAGARMITSGVCRRN